VSLPAYATLRFERPAEHVLLVVLNRPEMLNALDTQMGRDLLDLWTRIGAEPEAHRLHVNGRDVVVPRTAEGVAFMTFAELCERPLGAADYLALATRYHTLVLGGIPRLGPDKRNEAKFGPFLKALSKELPE